MRALALILLLAGATSAGDTEAPPARAWIGVAASMLRVDVERPLPGGFTGTATGSGSWTTCGVLTAWHVVKGASSVVVVEMGGGRHRAWRWWQVDGQDVAVVRLERPLNLPKLQIRAGGRLDLKAGAVRAEGWGFWGAGVGIGSVTRTDGDLVWGLVGDAGFQQALGRDFYAWTGCVRPGMSGGPVMVGGEVVGVVSHLREDYAAYVARVVIQDAPTCPPDV